MPPISEPNHRPSTGISEGGTVSEEGKKRWLWRECCDSMITITKTYGKIELFKCKCGRTVEGQYLKYFDTEADAIAERRTKKGFGMPGLEGLGDGDLDQYLQDHRGGL
jgi:hypothetical protein